MIFLICRLSSPVRNGSISPVKVIRHKLFIFPHKFFKIHLLFFTGFFRLHTHQYIKKNKIPCQYVDRLLIKLFYRLTRIRNQVPISKILPFSGRTFFYHRASLLTFYVPVFPSEPLLQQSHRCCDSIFVSQMGFRWLFHRGEARNR
jgi:hypothetical protein